MNKKLDRNLIIAKVLEKLKVAKLGASALNKLIIGIRKLTSTEEIFKLMKRTFSNYGLSQNDPRDKQEVAEILQRLERKEQLPAISPSHSQAFRLIKHEYSLRP